MQWQLTLRQLQSNLQAQQQWVELTNAEASDAASSWTTALMSTPEEAEDVVLSHEDLYCAINETVPLKLLLLAKKCEELGRPRVGKYFLVDTDGLGQPTDSCRWVQKLRGRGWPGFGHAETWLGFR